MIPRQEAVHRRPGRELQRNRTRRDLLAAARELVREGHAPGVAEAADRAGVSRTTAYRYFASQQALLAEAAVEPLIASIAAIVDDATERDPVRRVEGIFRQAVPLMLDRAAQLSAMLAVTLERSLGENLAGNAPLHSDSWIGAFDAVLDPLRGNVEPPVYVLMTRSLSTLLGIEALMTIEDTCDGDRERTVRAVSDAASAMAYGFLLQSRLPEKKQAQ